jgi:predicted TIM-barrel fold metal-dependent hydrolase
MHSSVTPDLIIDIHRHIAHPRLITNLASFPRELFLDEFQAQSNAASLPPPALSDIDVQLREQDRVGITRGVLNHPFPLADLKPQAGGVAHEMAAVINNDLAMVVAKHPDKLDFLASVHPFEPGFAQETDRSLTELGAKGLALTTSYAGRWLDDRALDPFWEYVQQRDVVLFLHPPLNPIWLPPNDRYPLQEMIYRPFDEVTSVTRMIFSGVFDRYPRLKVVLTFAGAGIMNLFGRLDYAYQVGSPTAAEGMCRRQPSSYIQTNLYVELGMAFSPTTVQQAINLFGSDRVLFGTDYPVGEIEEQLAIVKGLDLNPGVMEQLLWKNSQALFHLDIAPNAI